MQFRAICSKWNKKLTLSLTASSREEARSILHKQGYSIIEIQEVLDTSQLHEGNFFYFDIIVNGTVQTGKIQSDDIFKAYRKLIEDLKYDVVYIYTVPGAAEDQKKLITAKVKDGYNMYLDSVGGKLEEKIEPGDDKYDSTEDFSPQLLKELEKYAKIIDDTTLKIQNLLVKYHDIVTEEQRAHLQNVEIELVQIKWVRNIGKIQSVLEDSLKKIGAVELEFLEKWAVAEKAKFLAETNKLLQWVGSSERIQTEEEKQKDIRYQLQSLFGKIGNTTKKTEKPVNTGKKVDTNSFIYFKNKRELDIYKKTHQKNDSAIVKAIFSFQFAQAKRLLLKRRLLKQNIAIIENRINNRSISYTKIAHGMDYYINSFFGFISTLATTGVVGLFFYVLVYIVGNTLSEMNIISFGLTDKSPLFLALFSVFVFFITLVRGWKSMIVIIPLLFFIVSFLSINF